MTSGIARRLTIFSLAVLFMMLLSSCAWQIQDMGKESSAQPGSSGSMTESKIMSTDTGVSNREATSSNTPVADKTQTLRRQPRRVDVYRATESDGKTPATTDDAGKLMAQKETPAGTSSVSVEKDLVKFNFDNAELSEVIRSLAEIIGIKYIEDPNIQGKVTIHTADGVAKADLYPIFLRILETNGYTAVKEGPIYRITTLKDTSRLPLAFRFDKDQAPLKDSDRIVTQVITLKHTTPSDMIRIISPFLSAGGTVVAHEDTKTLIVVDKSVNVLKALRLVEAFDIDIFDKTNYSFFFLQNADAEEAVNILKEVFASTPGAGTGLVSFVIIKRLNAFLALSQNRKALSRIETLVAKIDAEAQGVEPRIYVYFVKNGEAANLASLLSQVFAKAGESGTQSTPTLETSAPTPVPRIESAPVIVESTIGPTGVPVQTTTAIPTTTAGPETTTPSTSASPPGLSTKAAATSLTPTASGTLKGEVKIVADEIRNALIIEAIPYDYGILKGILERIDVLPRQVLIEATIAEIKFDNSRDLGTEWSYLRDGQFGDGLQTLAIDGATGLTALIGFGNEVKSRFHALESANRVNILSSPHLLASDNREARIDVSNEIPIASSQTIISSGQPLVTTSVQYRDTGVLLAVTPHINERGLVTLDIFQEVSEQSENVLVAGVEYPSFFKRTVKTCLTVKHGQTIVLGGLIRENKGDRSSGVPWLHKIPILGFLFGRKTNNWEKTELIILLTPRVIVSLDDITTVTEDFERKVKTVTQGIL